MFDDLGLEQAVMDCCASGRHLTLFSMEDQKSSFGLSKIFNGSIKSRNPSSTNPFGNASLDQSRHSIMSSRASMVQEDSVKLPGMFRLAVESIFAHIFHAPGNEYLVKMRYLELNNETVFDLMQQGKPIISVD